MKAKILTTGEVGRLLSVKSDTVLKWIKSGRLQATKTLGGHYRIKLDSVKQLLETGSGKNHQQSQSSDGQVIYCWQYLSNIGQVNKQCQECPVHKLKVEKCFNLAKLGIEFKSGCTCKRECYKCPYYQFVNSNKTEVLLISEDNQIEEKILRHIKTDKVEIKLAKTAEEGRRLSNIFRPAFVLVEKINR